MIQLVPTWTGVQVTFSTSQTQPLTLEVCTNHQAISLNNGRVITLSGFDPLEVETDGESYVADASGNVLSFELRKPNRHRHILIRYNGLPVGKAGVTL